MTTSPVIKSLAKQDTLSELIQLVARDQQINFLQISTVNADLFSNGMLHLFIQDEDADPDDPASVQLRYLGAHANLSVIWLMLKEIPWAVHYFVYSYKGAMIGFTLDVRDDAYYTTATETLVYRHTQWPIVRQGQQMSVDKFYQTIFQALQANYPDVWTDYMTLPTE
jgi:hypothetical protein